MPGPIELQLFPSCPDCLSWSADGELAVAAGEYVHIITPKNTSDEGDIGSTPQAATGNWNITRFRANVFTHREWSTIYPQKRDDFSIGAEQSMSTVVGLAWSPPGLAKHRRSILAVLTSNQFLSFYEAAGPQGRWTRVAIVNEALKTHFQAFVHEKSHRLRKTNIRSFTWCPPLKVPVEETGSHPAFGLEARWGIQLLTVVNDDNDVIFLHTRRPKAEPSFNPFAFNILTLTSLHDLEGNYPVVQPGSIFASALKPQIRTLHVSCGPWLFQQRKGQGNACHVTGTAAAVYGSKLKMVKLDITLTPNSEPETGLKYKSVATSKEHPTMPLENTGKHHLIGPTQWIYQDGFEQVYVVVGSFAGFLVASAPIASYTGSNAGSTRIEVQEHPMYDSATGDSQDGGTNHWEPISAMAAAFCEEPSKSVPQLHLGTTGGYGGYKEFPFVQDNHSPIFSPPWKQQSDGIRDQFDIDRDLGGLVVGRVWGLAYNRGVIAAALTMHPRDMVEYCTAAEERTFIVFSSLGTESQEGEGGVSAFQQKTPDRSPDFLRTKREGVLGYILRSAPISGDSRLWCPRVVYAAACCAIVESQNEELLLESRSALKWLVTVTGADLSDEISKCSTSSNTVDPKSAEQLSGAGAQIFEKCDICDAGIAWYSTQESQCASGHLFVRCNLSMLSIQEPGISKLCSNCKTEYLNEDLIGPSQGTDLQHTYQMLSDVFDTCIYCNGKFSA
ncbi:hypothetical protein ASPWEDRAFT_99126 [Aspergillus wentii DTO 134E9]|uniref:Transcription factor IIIC putative zinc-finger domain-containing protein n=1 Tax=Aspergillus wentii DTO 134E9 TaxID=1073089 RepID=A0A1L9RYT8_ASPWE|nr:uncharacterized protein ASPWEDRAFT_99126 [Aspergillus wentii DTO 134E9]KAI9932496.1 hypothetical protein MW887_008737 [Aspergillus wentii]OJJ40063.1 hypothetical protein ASPWEDRAFT_99126 [Aspergillus wentii DTO 134E9]